MSVRAGREGGKRVEREKWGRVKEWMSVWPEVLSVSSSTVATESVGLLDCVSASVEGK